jgi:hypothetical protein
MQPMMPADPQPLPSEPTDPRGQMRIYAAILGREPELDPEAPDPFPATTARSLAGDVRRLGTTVAADLRSRRPATWQQLVGNASGWTTTAARRLREARDRLARRDAA